MEEKYAREAIELSIDMMRAGHGGPFGAVVVKDGRVVGRGYNRVTSTHDPTAHAEIVAIREACQTLETFELSDCELYASCEPCPMCLSAIYWARLNAVYFSATREDAADAGFDDDVIYQQIPLAPHERSLPMHQVLHDEAVVAFDEWKAKADKVAY